MLDLRAFLCPVLFSNVIFTSFIISLPGEKPYRCTSCDRSFACSTVLKSHMRTHTGERPYICSYCGKTFVYANGLITHTRKHTGEKPYQCQVCEKSFSSGSLLWSHSFSHSQEKRYYVFFVIYTYLFEYSDMHGIFGHYSILPTVLCT